MDLKKYKDHFIVFAEAGFIAVNQADEDSATKLFKAASLIDPKNLLPKVGMGYLHLCKLELKQACKVFDEILKEEPHNDMAKTFLGLCMSLNPAEVKQGEKLLEETKGHTKDANVKTLATSALEFIEKFIKKAPTPAEGQAKKEKH
jgi:uncharacterized membrane-anchored protein